MNYFEFKYVQIILISQLTLNISLQYWLEVAWVPKFGTYPTDLYGRTSACTEVMALGALLLFLHGQVADSKFRLASGGCDQCHQHPTESNTQWDPMGSLGAGPSAFHWEIWIECDSFVVPARLPGHPTLPIEPFGHASCPWFESKPLLQ